MCYKFVAQGATSLRAENKNKGGYKFVANTGEKQTREKIKRATLQICSPPQRKEKGYATNNAPIDS